MKAKLLLAVVLAALVTAGCSKSDSSSTTKPAAAKGRLFAVTFQTMNNPFFVELNEGIKKVVEAHGDRLVTLDAQWDSAKQKNDISDMILQGAAAIFINPVSWEGIKGSLLQAKDKKIPCIVVDAPAKDIDLALCTVASDNVEAGRLACRALAKVKPNAKLVILHYSVNKACIDRVAGFKEEMAKNPGMTLLDTTDAPGTIEDARPKMKDLLGRFKELDAAFPINDPSAIGCISALESVNRVGEVTVVTVDGSAAGIAKIKEGKLHSTSAQFPAEIGRVAAEKAYDGLAGKPVEQDIKIKVELITKENADEFLKKK